MPARDITPQYKSYLKELGAAYSQAELEINKKEFKKNELSTPVPES